jgi:hypothetical protein
MMMSALKMTADRIADSGVFSAITSSTFSGGNAPANIVGMMAKYFATSFATENVVIEPRVMSCDSQSEHWNATCPQHGEVLCLPRRESQPACDSLDYLAPQLGRWDKSEFVNDFETVAQISVGPVKF